VFRRIQDEVHQKAVRPFGEDCVQSECA
jgi:hypothetical protein